MLVTAAPGGCGTPSCVKNCSKRRRSSAISITAASEPMIGMPAAVSGPARVIAGCPPSCTIEGGGVGGGGEVSRATLVENFPGFPKGVQGPALIEMMQRQADEFGAGFKESK